MKTQQNTVLFSFASIKFNKSDVSDEAMLMLTKEAIKNYNNSNYEEPEEPVTLAAEIKNERKKQPCCQR